MHCAHRNPESRAQLRLSLSPSYLRPRRPCTRTAIYTFARSLVLLARSDAKHINRSPWIILNSAEQRRARLHSARVYIHTHTHTHVDREHKRARERERINGPDIFPRGPPAGDFIVRNEMSRWARAWKVTLRSPRARLFTANSRFSPRAVPAVVVTALLLLLQLEYSERASEDRESHFSCANRCPPPSPRVCVRERSSWNCFARRCV